MKDAVKSFADLGEQVVGDNSPVKPTDQRVKGKVIKLSDKGWGFISSKEISFTRIFFHWTSLKQNTLNFKELKKGMMVEFTPQEVPEKGFRAIKIEVLAADEQKATA